MSASRKRHKGAKEKRDGGAFVAVPLGVLRSRAYRELTMKAKALLLDMLGQYSGSNNGDICAAFSVMAKYGWRSEQTLFEARNELEDSGLIFETRKGARPNKATLYGFTFYGLDESSKLDVSARAFPRGRWRDKDTLRLVEGSKIARLTTKSVVGNS